MESKIESKKDNLKEGKNIQIDPVTGRKRVFTVNKLPSKTDQQYKMDCDVNYIVSKFQKTGHISHLSKFQGKYADVSAIPDLHEALINVKMAESAFLDVPASIRKRFHNNPVELLNFLSDPENREEAELLGLIPKPEKTVSVQPDAQPETAVKNDD